MDTKASPQPLDPAKFRDPLRTATGEQRASVPLVSLRTLWVNTGTLCNIACEHCYIESSPTNDRYSFLTPGEIVPFLDEVESAFVGTGEFGFTGGEPFLNPWIFDLLSISLERGFEVLVLTNAMRPMMRPRIRAGLEELREAHRSRLTLRVSLDHFESELHDSERGAGSFDEALEGLRFLAARGFRIHIATRTRWDTAEADLRTGFAELFAREGFEVDAFHPVELVLFPELDARHDVPEITTKCWGILGVRPDSMMCATSRMVVRRKEAEAPSVVACTLLPFETRFELGGTLTEAAGPVQLNHPHCARFCVLGGGSCSG